MYTVLYDNQTLYKPGIPEMQMLTGVVDTEIGKAGTFEFSIAPNNTAYNSLMPLKTRIKVLQDGKRLFEGRVLYTSRDMVGIKTVYCEGELSYLVDSVQRPYKFNGYPIDLLTQYINQHNSQVEESKRFVLGDTSAFPVIDPSKIPQPNVTYTYSYVTTRRLEMYGQDTVDSRIVGWIPEGKTVNRLGGGTNGLTYVSYNGQSGYAPSSGIQRKATVAGTTQAENPYYIKVEASTYENTLDAINSNIVDAFGGFLSVRHESDGMYLDYISTFSEVCDQTIEFGKNMIDLSDQITAENVYTVILPLGANKNGSRVNITTVNNNSDTLESSTGVSLFGRIVRAVEFDDQSDPQSLMEAAQTALNNAILEALTINITAVDLSVLDVNTDAIQAGTKVRIKSEPHGINGALMLCTETSIDLLNPQNSSFTIGDTYGTMTDTQNKNWNRLRNNIYTINGIGARVTGIEEYIEEEKETTT